MKHPILAQIFTCLFSSNKGVFCRFSICSAKIFFVFDEPSMLHGDNFSHRWSRSTLCYNTLSFSLWFFTHSEYHPIIQINGKIPIPGIEFFHLESYRVNVNCRARNLRENGCRVAFTVFLDSPEIWGILEVTNFVDWDWTPPLLGPPRIHSTNMTR